MIVQSTSFLENRVFRPGADRPLVLLHVDVNKTRLFQFLLHVISQCDRAAPVIGCSTTLQAEQEATVVIRYAAVVTADAWVTFHLLNPATRLDIAVCVGSVNMRLLQIIYLDRVYIWKSDLLIALLIKLVPFLNGE